MPSQIFKNPVPNDLLKNLLTNNTKALTSDEALKANNLKMCVADILSMHEVEKIKLLISDKAFKLYESNKLDPSKIKHLSLQEINNEITKLSPPTENTEATSTTKFSDKLEKARKGQASATTISGP